MKLKKMKKVIIVLSLLCFAVLGFSQRYDYQDFTMDTLTNADTNTYTWDENIYDHGSLEYYAQITVISGTGAGTIYYEYSLTPNPGALEWYTVSTDTIASSGITQAQHHVDNWVGYDARIRVITSGTQSTSCNPFISFKAGR